MFHSLNEQKKDINQFYFNSQMTGSELFLLNYYVEFIEKDLHKLQNYLNKIKKTNPRNTSEIIQNMNDIRLQMSMLKSEDQSLDEEIKKINELVGIQATISGRVLKLRADLHSSLKKAEHIINKHL